MASLVRGKNKNKPWTVRYFHEGKQSEVSYRTKAEALDFIAKFEHDRRANIFVTPKQANIRFADAAQSWLERHPGTPKTLKVYGDVLRLHVNPAIGRLGLTKVANDREALERFLTKELPAKGLGASSIRTCYTVISAVVNDAIRGGRLGTSRLAGISLPPVLAKAEIPFASHEQILALANGMPSPESVWTIYLMRGCGLRLGEALGVADGDVTDGSLRLARQLSQNGVEFIPLKHRGEGQHRDIPVPAYVVEAKPSTYPYDSPVSHRKYRDWFNAARDKAGLPSSFTPHTLRHIFASTCLAGGIPISTLAHWLGHNNIQTTFGIYGHLVPNSFEQARKVLDDEWTS